MSGHPIVAVPAGRFRAPMLHRNIGLFPADFGFYPAPIADGFDVLLHVDRTTATTPIRRGPPPRPGVPAGPE